LGKFRDGYTIKVFGFDSQVTEMTEKQLKVESVVTEIEDDTMEPVPPVDGNGQDQDSEPVAETEQVDQRHRQQTNVVTALETVRDQIPKEKLAGVLLVSDGRHNGKGDLGTVAREFANRQVPISAIVVGSSKAPVDAAIVDLEAPTTMFVEDQLRVRARIKVAGMKGRKVRLVMTHGEEQPIKQEITIDQDEFAGVV